MTQPKMLKVIKKNFLLILIFVLAFVVRFMWPDTPPSLNWDEISHGYNAFSILNTGSDEWGQKLPIIFRAYGDYKLPLYIYITAVFESLFGLTPIAVRLPSILAGIGTVIFTYFLTLELFKNNKSIATASSLLVALSPWTFFLSRAAFEANLALFFFVAGFYFFLRALNSQYSIYHIFYSLFFGLTVWAYNSYRIFTPLFLIFLIYIYREEFKNLFRTSKKLFIFPLLIVSILIIPMFYQLITTAGLARYSKVSILDTGAINKINEMRQTKSRLVANKITYFASEFTKNYFSYFDPRFLFMKGGSQYQFSVPNTGLLYLVNLPFFVFGLLLLLKSKSKEQKMLLVWMILAPVAGSITREAPHVLRGITFLPLPMILISLGFSHFVNNLKSFYRSSVTVLYISVILFSFGIYVAKYLNYYRDNYSQAWQYGYSEAVSYIENNYEKYDKILVTKKYGEPHEFVLFFLAYSPKRYMNDKNLNRFYQSGWWWVDGFDKFYFLNDWQVRDLKLESGSSVDCSETKCLLISSPDNYPKGFKKLDKINFLDGKPAFEIYENK